MFCLAPVKSSSPRSAMGLSRVEAGGLKQRPGEGEDCGMSVQAKGERRWKADSEKPVSLTCEDTRNPGKGTRRWEPETAPAHCYVSTARC